MEIPIDKKKDSKLSYEEIIYDIITEIPHYFDFEHKFKDDMNIRDSKVKHYENISIEKSKENSSKSVERNKNLKDGLKRKSNLMLCRKCEEKDIVKIDEKDPCLKLISSCETTLNTEKASLKYEDDNYSLAIYSGVAIITDFRFVFQFDDLKIIEELSLSEYYYSIPLFCINR